MIITHDATPARGLSIYVDGQIVMQATKAADLISIARDALTGQLVLPSYPEPVPMRDHGHLLLIASDAASLAADVI